MTEKEIIGNFLNIERYDTFKKENRLSTLIIALKGARKICGRDLETGKLENKNLSIGLTEEVMLEGRYYSSLLLGLTNYLIIIDLIGSIFKLKSPKKEI